jgi:hypothetical protein
MNLETTLLGTLLLKFQDLEAQHPHVFVALGKFPSRDVAALDAFTPIFFELEGGLRPDTWIGREGTVIDPDGTERQWADPGPMRMLQFADGQESEWLFWGSNGRWGAFCDVAAAAWRCLPIGFYTPTPLFPFFRKARLQCSHDAELWLNFVFNRLRGCGGLVAAVEGKPSVLYLTVGAFAASALVVEKLLQGAGLPDVVEDYLPAHKVLSLFPDRFPTLKTLKYFLSKYPHVPTNKPNKKVLLIHLNKLVKCLAGINKPIPDDQVTAALQREVEAKKEKARRKKRG